MNKLETKEFIKRSSMPVSAKELFDWHKQPGAFDRLSPPWMNVKIVDRQGDGIRNGTRLTIVASSGLLSSRQIIEHVDYIEGEQFRDIQVKGPFSLWEHTHRVYSTSAESSVMEDAIRYRLPAWSFLIRSWLEPFIARELERLFYYRHHVLQHDLAIKGAKKMKILVTGATGLVCSALIPFLKTKGHQIIKLVRDRSELAPDEIHWDVEKGVIDPKRLEGLDAVIHLAGENIGKGRWTEEKKKKILDSRVVGTRLLCQALAGLKQPPNVLISASAIGYYGDRGSELLTETSAKGEGFLADVCEQWEEATVPAKQKGIRVANMRTGMVLSPRGGGLKQMLIPFEWGLGGRLGSGRQYMSWIAIDDLLDAILYLMENEHIQGAVNVVSPHPVTNETFTKTLGQVLHRPTILAMPEFVARLFVGQMADELLLSSVRVEPSVLEEQGFHFSYPTLEPALKNLLGKNEA